MNQLSLFSQPALISVPNAIRWAMLQGATLAISISGGKDSHALLIELSRWFRQEQFSGQLLAIHADLGRAEWAETPAFVERICAESNVPLVVVRRPKGDLVARIEERLESTQGTTAPFWPSAESRYCMSHLKSGPIDTALRKPFWPSSEQRYCTSDSKRNPVDTGLREHLVVISAEGVRADESTARAKKPVVEIRSAITAKALLGLPPQEALSARTEKQRVALNWRPLLHYSEEQIWQAIGTSGQELKHRQHLYRSGLHEEALLNWPAHPAYVFGNARLSCALCVLGSKSDLTNGANHNPDLYAHYLGLERKGNSTFKNGWSLAELPVSGRAKEIRDEHLKTAPSHA